jgi:hypothetical protein
VVAVRVHEDRPVTVDAPTEEIGEVLVGHRQRPERETLSWRESDVAEPAIELSVPPLQPVAGVAQPPAHVPEPIADSKNAADRFQELDVVGREAQGVAGSREVPVARHEADDPGDFG